MAKASRKQLASRARFAAAAKKATKMHGNFQANMRKILKKLK
jgi:hypothetical protein